jgi:L-amino acid N-acyltransferase YncA
MAEINIRAATTAADLDAVWHLWKAVVDQKIYFPYDETYTRAQMEAIWINLNNPVYVAELNGQIVGAYILRPNQPGYGKHIANASYMVDTQIRGKKIGTLLCAHSIQTAKTLQYRGMQFNLVVSTNESAVRAWKANGFEIIGTIPGGFRHAELGYVDAYIFFKDLTKDS